MNLYIQYTLAFVGFVGALALLAGGIGVLKGAFSKKQVEEKSDVISSADQQTKFWKEQVEGFRDIIKELTAKMDKQKDDHTVEMKKLLTEMGEVRGQLKAESAQKTEYLAILQNRDPETKKFMEYMVQAVKNQTDSQQAIIKLLGEIHTMAKAEHERDFNITATVTKTP